MANNYLQPVNNHFGHASNVATIELEDVADDIFLNSYNRSKSNSSRINEAYRKDTDNKNVMRSTNPFEVSDSEITEQQRQEQILLDRKRQIEERSLHSTQKSLGLLCETEEVGEATATELVKQREQLEKTSRQLDEISASLRFSQRHLNSLKSVFGGLKNYLAGNREHATTVNKCHLSNETNQMNEGDHRDKRQYNVHNTRLTEEKYESHPINRSRNPMGPNTQTFVSGNTNPFQQQLEANLEEMCDNLSRLKCLATDMNREIESQNELLDNVNYKIDDVDIKMAKQNKEMNKLLGKK